MTKKQKFNKYTTEFKHIMKQKLSPNVKFNKIIRWARKYHLTMLLMKEVEGFKFSPYHVLDTSQKPTSYSHADANLHSFESMIGYLIQLHDYTDAEVEIKRCLGIINSQGLHKHWYVLGKVYIKSLKQYHSYRPINNDDLKQLNNQMEDSFHFQVLDLKDN